MTPFQERLAASRAFVTATREQVSPLFPGFVVDQVHAATVEAHQGFEALAQIAEVLDPDPTWRTWTQDPRNGREAYEEAIARVFAAITACKVCVHVRDGGPQPAWALLPLHVVVCDQCRTTTDPSPPAGEDDQCDWCGTRGVVFFTPVNLQHGPLVVIGEACDDCANALHGRNQ